VVGATSSELSSECVMLCNVRSMAVPSVQPFITVAYYVETSDRTRLVFFGRTEAALDLPYTPHCCTGFEPPPTDPSKVSANIAYSILPNLRLCHFNYGIFGYTPGDVQVLIDTNERLQGGSKVGAWRETPPVRG